MQAERGLIAPDLHRSCRCVTPAKAVSLEVGASFPVFASGGGGRPQGGESPPSDSRCATHWRVGF